jgi:hypothetical protein
VFPDCTVTVKGEFGQLTPGGKLDGQLTITLPVNPPFGVTVTVDIWLVAVVEFNVTALVATATLGGSAAVTVKLKGNEVPAGDGSTTYSGYVPGASDPT